MSRNSTGDPRLHPNPQHPPSRQRGPGQHLGSQVPTATGLQQQATSRSRAAANVEGPPENPDTPREISEEDISIVASLHSLSITPEEERKMDEAIMRSIGNGQLYQQTQQQEPLSADQLSHLLLAVVSNAHKLLDQSYRDVVKAEELLTADSHIRSILLADLKNRNFNETRRLTVLQRNDIETKTRQMLITHYPTLFALLTLVKVSPTPQWKIDDVKQNCIMHESFSDIPIPSEMSKFEEDLGRLRPYRPLNKNEFDIDLYLAKLYPDQFRQVFYEEPKASSPNPREFFSFYVLNHTFLKDTVAVFQDSSSFKTGTFCHFFVHTPLLYIPSSTSSSTSVPAYEYKQEQAWKFPIFIDHKTEKTLRRYTPVPDWFVMDDGSLCPLIISEIISQPNQDDENRMLMQAIAAVRVGQYFTVTQNKFFMVAIYLDKKFEARRYILMHDHEANQVHVVKRRFNLKGPNDAIRFFLEMLNFKDRLEDQSKRFSQEHKDKLRAIAQMASKLPSLHSKEHSASEKKDKDKTDQSQHQASGQHYVNLADALDVDEINEDMYGAFHAHLQREVEKMGYEISYVSSENPNLALVYPKTGPETIHYVKFVPGYSDELSIIKHLNSLESPFTNIIRPISSSTLTSGSLMVMARVGEWITTFDNLSVHIMGLIFQLLHGVQFLHDNLVAHMDLKPENLLVLSTDGNKEPKLTIIDFSSAIWVFSRWDMVDKVVGTEGYMAPEIGQGQYDPFKADLWSFGVVLKELCEGCEEFPQRSLVLDVAGQLTQAIPKRRPALSDVMKQLRNPSVEDEVPRLMKLESFSDRKTVSVF